MRDHYFLLVLFFQIFFLPFASTQELHIYFDSFRDSLWYVKNGKTVEYPTVKIGSPIILHVENFNNHLYNIAVEVENRELQVSGGIPMAALTNLVTGGAGGSPMLLNQGGDQALDQFNIISSIFGGGNNISGFAPSLSDSEKKEQIAKLKLIESEFTSAKERMFDLANEMRTIEEEAEKKVQSARLQQFAAAQIKAIHFNPNLEPRQIKALASEYMVKIFNEKDPDKITLDKLIQMADNRTEIPKMIQNYKEKSEEYKAKLEECRSLVTEIKKLDITDLQVDNFYKKGNDFLQLASDKTAVYAQNIELMEEKTANMQNLDPETLATLRTTYLELVSNSFSKTYHYKASGELTTLKIKMTPMEEAQRNGLSAKTAPPIEIDVTGGIEVKAGIGFNFGQFAKPSKEYFLRDNTIQASDSKNYLPTLTSFIHIFAYNPKPVSLAGSFGIGVPIGGGGSLQSLSFFLGPSLIFGKSQRMVFNTGIMIGKVDRLSNGYNVGDEFISPVDNPPLKNAYELGYFFGVSFNLLKG